jgi:hypothetical protein
MENKYTCVKYRLKQNYVKKCFKKSVYLNLKMEKKNPFLVFRCVCQRVRNEKQVKGKPFFFTNLELDLIRQI